CSAEENRMGTWGPSNFENDAALDLVEDVLKGATTEVEAFCASGRAGVEDLDAILAAVAVHLALHGQCNASAPTLELVATLREKVLRIYDEEIDSLNPQDDYKVQRRATIEDTLRRYEAAAREGG